MAKFRVRPSLPIFFAFLTIGVTAFVNRKKLMPEVYERRKAMKYESVEQAATVRDALKRRKEANRDN